MNIKLEEYTKGLTTSVGIISSRGALGDNLMSAEWTYLVSYDPAIFTVHIGNRKSKATAENIAETKVFGVSMAASHHNTLTSIIGNHSGHDVDKVAILEELGYTFERGQETGVLYVKDSVLALECRLMKVEPIGDHTMFMGEVVAIMEGTSEDPLLYNKKKYWKIGEKITKPSDEERAKQDEIVERYRRNIS